MPSAYTRLPRTTRVSLAIWLTTESKPQLAMPAKVSLAGLAEVESALDAGGEDRARGHRLARNPEHAAQVVAPAAGQHADDAVGVLDRAGDRADQPIAPKRDRHLAVPDGFHRELASVLEALRVLEAVLEPLRSQRGLHLGQAPARDGPRPRRD